MKRLTFQQTALGVRVVSPGPFNPLCAAMLNDAMVSLWDVMKTPLMPNGDEPYREKRIPFKINPETIR